MCVGFSGEGSRSARSSCLSSGTQENGELLAQYRAHGGRVDDSHWRFCLAFNFFRLAAIAQGVARRALQGNASSERAQATGNLAGASAEQGREVAGV